MSETSGPARLHTGKRRRSPLLPIFLTIFIDLIGLSILIPVFPLLINLNTPFHVIPSTWSPRQGLIMLGWLQAVYPLCTFVAAPVLGQLSDRFGRRPVLAISIAGTALGYAVFAFGISWKSVPLLFLGRAIDGITGGNIAVAQAVIGDVSDDTNRARNFGLIGAAFGLGFILGPYIGGRLSAPSRDFYHLFTTPSWFSPTTPFWFAFGLCVLNVGLVLTNLPETIRDKDPNREIDVTRSVHNVINGFRSGRLRIPLLASFWYALGFTFFTTFFGVYLSRKFGFNQAETGDFFALIGIAIAFTQMLVVGRTAKRYSDFQVLRVSMFMTSVGLAFYFLASVRWQLWAAIPFFTLFNSHTLANTTSLISRSAAPGRQGEAMGISSSVTNLAQVPASALLGYITGSITSNTPLVVACVCTTIAGLVFNLFFKPTYVAARPVSSATPAR